MEADREIKNSEQAKSAAGFETEDVLYLLPLVTLFDVAGPFLVAAAIGAPLFAVWVMVDYYRTIHRDRASIPMTSRSR